MIRSAHIAQPSARTAHGRFGVTYAAVMPMSLTPLAVAGVLAAACAPPPAAPAPPESSANDAAVGPASGEASPPGAPRYKPSSSSPAPVPITEDAYGAYGPADAAPHVGDQVPDFELPLADGGRFALGEARRAGPVVVLFYRGFW